MEPESSLPYSQAPASNNYKTSRLFCLQRKHLVHEYFLTVWVPVNTAWRVLRLRMEERPPIWRVAANKLNKQSRKPTMGGPPAWGLGEALTTPPREKKILLRNTYVFLYVEFNDKRVWVCACCSKGKAVPLQALTGPAGSRSLRLPDTTFIWTMAVVTNFTYLNE